MSVRLKLRTFALLAACLSPALPLLAETDHLDPNALDISGLSAFLAYIATLALFCPTFLLFGIWTRRFWLTAWVLLGITRVIMSVRTEHPRYVVFHSQVGILVILLAFVAFLAISVRRRGSSTPVDLAFPCGRGNYAVIQGGASLLVNHHLRSDSQRYAIDFVRVAEDYGLAPLRGSLDDFPTYDVPVLSPCHGVISEVVESASDKGMGDPISATEPFGNHVVIRSAEAVVVVAHLKQWTLQVSAGDIIIPGQVLGLAGNSGRSSEPHVHIHVENLKELGVPMTFEGRTLVRNSLFEVF